MTYKRRGSGDGIGAKVRYVAHRRLGSFPTVRIVGVKDGWQRRKSAAQALVSSGPSVSLARTNMYWLQLGNAWGCNEKSSRKWTCKERELATTGKSRHDVCEIHFCQEANHLSLRKRQRRVQASA